MGNRATGVEPMVGARGLGRRRATRCWSGVVLAVVVCWPEARARAQYFSDDFEGNFLLQTQNPAGVWTKRTTVNSSLTMGTSAAAAHRGDKAGLRVAGCVTRRLRWGRRPTSRAIFPGVTGDFYARFWMRQTVSNNVGEAMIPVEVGRSLRLHV